MSYSKVELSLMQATENFDEMSARKEILIKESREMTSLSSKTIALVHTPICTIRETSETGREKG